MTWNHMSPTPIHNDTEYGDFSITVLSAHKYQVWYKTSLIGHCIYTIDKGWWFKCHSKNYNVFFKPLENVKKEREVESIEQLVNKLNKKLWSNTWTSRLKGKLSFMLQAFNTETLPPQNALYPIIQDRH